MTRANTLGEPLVSVVLPTLNGARFIGSSIASCLAQTYENFELIVVDGGSTDGTPDIVRSISDRRVRLVFQHGNVNRLPGGLNTGLAGAAGGWLTWTPGDDLV